MTKGQFESIDREKLTPKARKMYDLDDEFNDLYKLFYGTPRDDYDMINLTAELIVDMDEQADNLFDGMEWEDDEELLEAIDGGLIR